MKLVLTNDDGIDAPGLAALAAAAAPFGDLVVVAPSQERSNCGHQVTTHAPIRIEERGPGRYAVHGTPADCVRVALHRLAPDAAWVLSGINHGGNLGTDIYHSGTAAAAREAALHGVPGVACSHYRRRGVAVRWDEAAAWLRPVLAGLLGAPAQAGRYWNVNLPHPDPGAAAPAMVRCALDPSPLPLGFRLTEAGELHYSGDYHQRARLPGRDIDVCMSGAISITEIPLG